MAALVVDASVVAKWYLPERDHERARAIRDGYLDGRHDLLAPVLLPYEVVNALKYSGQYAGQRLIDASRSVVDYGISLVPYRDGGPVAETAVELDITLYDASYLALAWERDATVYTADSRLIDAANESRYAGCVSHIETYPGS